jgi:hypothetical protein
MTNRFILSTFNNNERVISLALDTALNGSKLTPVILLKDSLVLGELYALGGNNFNFDFGIAQFLASKVFNIEIRALF